MPEQRLSRQTVYGWLSVLTMMSVLRRDQSGPVDLSRQVALPVGVIDLAERVFLVVSPPLWELLGWPGEVPERIDLRVLVERPASLDALLDLLIDGFIDAYQATRAMTRADGSRVQAHVWVAAWGDHGRHRALAVFAPVGEDAGRALPAPEPAQWPDDVSGVAIGTFDAEWRVERASVDIETLLGYRSDEVVGSPFIRILHPDDVPALLAAAARALADQTAVGVGLRVRHKNGDWLPTQAIITPLAAERLRFGFVLAAAGAAGAGGARGGIPAASSGRVATLERHLLRIAQELEAAGVAAGFEPVPDLSGIAGLADLSARQWEILTRLLRGERVPTMASALFLSQSTVRNHLTQIFRRTGVHSQEELLSLLRGSRRELG